MRTITLLSILSVALMGCSTTSVVKLKEDPAALAQRIGNEPSELLYVSNGHFTPAAEVSDYYHFTADTFGLVALTEESLMWSMRSDIYAPNYTLQDIQLATIDGVSYHRGYLQLKIGEEIHILRPTLENPFKNTSDHTAELFAMLLSRNVPELELENPFRPKQKRPYWTNAANPNESRNPSEWRHEITFPEKAHIPDGNGGYIMGTAIRR
ncbi:MAG: hypothetical protein SynsKO_21100 [Synoicihabitans sp.]